MASVRVESIVPFRSLRYHTMLNVIDPAITITAMAIMIQGRISKKRWPMRMNDPLIMRLARTHAQAFLVKDFCSMAFGLEVTKVGRKERARVRMDRFEHVYRSDCQIAERKGRCCWY